MIIFVVGFWNVMEAVVSFINDIVWSPALVVLLVGAGLYFSIRTRFVQVRRIGLMVRLLFSNNRSAKDETSDNQAEGSVIENADETETAVKTEATLQAKQPPKSKSKSRHERVSSFQAFCIALSGRVGTGNIVGVATAIALGGPGAVFWMWITAFLGASTAFMESTLAQIHRFKTEEGWRGGPAAYIEKGLNSRWLGIVFAIFTILGYGIFCMTVQANSLSGACHNAFSLPPIVIGIFLVILVLLVTLGGVKRIANFASVVTPFMALAYMIMAIVILAFNIDRIPATFLSIFKSAFGVNPFLGGILGSTIMMGVKRGLFSNEAGEGGGAIISAVADVDHPAKQGLVQAFSVYIDTLIVCTCTALMILCTGQYNVLDAETGNIILMNAPELGDNYVGYTQSAIDQVFHGFGSGFVAVALVFFAYTTMIAYTVYADSSIVYLCKTMNYKKRAKMAFRYIYVAVAVVMIVYGSVTSSRMAWLFADIGIGLTTWINVIVLFILCPKALASLKDLESKCK